MMTRKKHFIYPLLVIVVLLSIQSCKDDDEPTPKKLAQLTTKSISEITLTSGKSGGEITDDGGAEITVRGICWSTSQNPTINNDKTSEGSGMGEFISSMSNLITGTTYYVRAYATNNVGTAYGNEVSFTTGNVQLPMVSTSVIADITTSTASGGGNITSDGGGSITARGVCWSTSQNPSVTDNKTTDGTGTGSFTSALSGLMENTTYYVRAYATNEAGTGYGDPVEFTTGKEIAVDIYVVGGAKIEGQWVPAYWKNGTRSLLNDGVGGLHGVYVKGEDVYLTGWSENHIGKTKYWKNGTGYDLTGNSQQVRGIAVSNNNDVYVCGFQYAPGMLYQAVYWKNGELIPLTAANPHTAMALSITVTGNDVYIAGFEQGDVFDEYGFRIKVAKYWKNGEAVSLTDGTKNAEANSIKVVNDDVYVAGYEQGVARYWKNGGAVTLTNGTYNAVATDITVVGNDVYVSGYEADGTNETYKAKYWKNGMPVPLTDGSVDMYAMQIAVSSNHDVYVVTDDYTQTYLYKNGVLMAPFDGSQTDYYIGQLFIVEH